MSRICFFISFKCIFGQERGTTCPTGLTGDSEKPGDVLGFARLSLAGGIVVGD